MNGVDLKHQVHKHTLLGFRKHLTLPGQQGKVLKKKCSSIIIQEMSVQKAWHVCVSHVTYGQISMSLTSTSMVVILPIKAWESRRESAKALGAVSPVILTSRNTMQPYRESCIRWTPLLYVMILFGLQISDTYISVCTPHCLSFPTKTLQDKTFRHNKRTSFYPHSV